METNLRAELLELKDREVYIYGCGFLGKVLASYLTKQMFGGD